MRTSALRGGTPRALAVLFSLAPGRVVLFADDPLFRLFWRSAFAPFANALLYGSSLR